MEPGPKDKTAAVTREELERALRHSNAMVMSLRDDILILGSQLVALTRELERRGHVREADVLAALPAITNETRIDAEHAAAPRVNIAPNRESKYDAKPLDIPCAELLPICAARCCQLSFALNSQDLNEGVVRWDYIAPYSILCRADDHYCVHNDADSKECQLYEQRPLPCRQFDCRDDPRIWADFAKRELAPMRLSIEADLSPEAVEKAHLLHDSERRQAMACEEYCIDNLKGLRKPD